MVKKDEQIEQIFLRHGDIRFFTGLKPANGKSMEKWFHWSNEIQSMT